MLFENFTERTLPLLHSNMLIPPKIISIGKTIKAKHYNMLDFSSCKVEDIKNSYITITFVESYLHLNFFPHDPIILSTPSIDNEIYRVTGEVFSVKSLNPLEIIVKVCKVETRENLRISDRFTVSLKGTLTSPSTSTSDFAIVKNISEKGFKLNSKINYEINEVLSFSTTLDSLYKISCMTKILRKNKFDNFYVYGVEITDISNENNKILKNYLNKLENGIFS